MRRQFTSILLSGGMWLLPVQGPVQDHLQPLIPEPKAAQERDGVPGYPCGHPRKGYEYAKMKGVGNLPSDILTGGWICSNGCSPEYSCAMVIKTADPRKVIVSDYPFVFRQKPLDGTRPNG